MVEDKHGGNGCQNVLTKGGCVKTKASVLRVRVNVYVVGELGDEKSMTRLHPRTESGSIQITKRQSGSLGMSLRQERE